MRWVFLMIGLVAALPAGAQVLDERDAFVEANVLSIFYHELGHAVIDLMEVPIFGQEEDAADVMSVLMIDWLYDEETAQALAYDSAFGFINDPDQTEPVAYWALHGPDAQRYYNHVCLFYGANPEARDDLAADLGLPAERAETCAEEYEQAAASWGAVFDDMDSAQNGVPMVFVASDGAGDGAEAADVFVNRILAAEVEAMNANITLPEQVSVRAASCGEPNAFYDPADASVTFCTEFIPHLSDIYDALVAN